MKGLNRRTFLQQSAVLTSGIAMPGFIKMPVLEAVSFQNESPVASTKYGKIRGYVDNDINVFKGVPYGGDTSKRRFMSPLPPITWTGIREYSRVWPFLSTGRQESGEDE